MTTDPVSAIRATYNILAIERELVGGTDEFSFGDPFLVELKGIEGVHELIPLDLETNHLDPADITAG